LTHEMTLIMRLGHQALNFGLRVKGMTTISPNMLDIMHTVYLSRCYFSYILLAKY